jgi:hypothetical protein
MRENNVIAGVSLLSLCATSTRRGASPTRNILALFFVFFSAGASVPGMKAGGIPHLSH